MVRRASQDERRLFRVREKRRHAVFAQIGVDRYGVHSQGVEHATSVGLSRITYVVELAIQDDGDLLRDVGDDTL